MQVDKIREPKMSGLHHIAYELFRQGRDGWQLKEGEYHLTAELNLNPVYFYGGLHLNLAREVQSVFKRFGAACTVQQEGAGPNLSYSIRFPERDFAKLAPLFSAVSAKELNDMLQHAFPLPQVRDRA